MKKTHYSCKELADFNLPGKPGSRQGWDSLVKKEGWSYVEVRSPGVKGMTREYAPSASVAALIDAKEREHPRADEQAAMYIVNASQIPEAAAIDNAGFVLIDKYVDVKGSAGPGQNVPEEAIVQVKVDARLLRERVGNNFGYLKLAGVSGDSMEPTLSHGDQVVIDTSCDRFIDDAIYAIQQDGHLRFKRIKLKLDGSIIVKSDNKVDNDPETYTKEEAQYFRVIGRVIPFKFGRFKI